MSISCRSRRFHDPWGSRRGNRQGSVIKWSYMVGQADLTDDFGKSLDINKNRQELDTVAIAERNTARFVFAKRSVEAIRR